MKRIVSAVSKISLASAANITTGIIRTKIFAVILGTAGVGVVSQLTSFSGLVLFVCTAGIPIGITKLVSEFEKEGKWQEIYDILNNSLALLVLVGVISLVLTFCFASEVSELILDSSSYSNYIVIVAMAFPFSVVMIVLDAYLRGLKKFNHYVKISIINAVISLLTTVGLVYYFSILGFAISLFLISILNIIVYVWFLHKNKLIELRKFKLLAINFTDSLKMILKLGAAALVLGALDQFTMIFIRSVLVKTVGVESTGIYQSVAGISNNYFAVFYMSISTYILPVLSEKDNRHEVNVETNSAFRLTLLLIIPICTFTFVAREFIIMILYTDNFLPAANLMLYNFVGDFFKALSWVLGAWLIPASRIRLWLLLGFIYYFNYCISFLSMNMLSNDLRNVVISYLVAGLVHFLLNLYFIRKYNGFEFQKGIVKLFLYSFGVICIIFGISSYNLVWGYIVIVPMLIVWALYSVRKDELLNIVKLILPDK